MQLKNKQLFWIFAVLVSFGFDRLFWEKPAGINFFIFVVLMLLGGLIPMWLEKISIPWTSYLLLIPILFFSGMTFVLSEPFTVMISGAIALCSLILFAATLRSGTWLKLRTREYFLCMTSFLLNSFFGGFSFLSGKEEKGSGENQSAKKVSSAKENKKEQQLGKKAAPYLRGILLALPVLAVLTALLASADPVFSNRVQSLFSGFQLDAFGEYLFRLFYIFVFAYVILSAYYYGLVESKKWQAEPQEKRPNSGILGSIESSIILGAINLLFLLFVILQFTYLFGGESNIHLEGFTYAEYARRGFSELLAVAMISLLVFYLLSMITRRESKAKQWTFSILGLILVGLVGIILASAYLRLTLYEAAYGFTRLRTLTHIFMIWTGLLLVGVAVLDLLKKMDRMAVVLVLMIFGFGLTLNLLNIDRFIVTQNISRSIEDAGKTASSSLDAGYLYSLSYDSIPPLVNYFTDAATPENIRDDVGGVLACRYAALNLPKDAPWTSFHLSRSRAISLLQSQAKELDAYPIHVEYGEIFVEVKGENRSCSGFDEFYLD